MIYHALRDRLPAWLADWTMHFEAEIERCVSDFAESLEAGVLVLDAGAGESRHAEHFSRQQYIGVDLAIGDSNWNYSSLDALGDLTALPFRNSTFDAAINIVTPDRARAPA